MRFNDNSNPSPIVTSIPTGIYMLSKSNPVATFLPLGPNHLPDNVVEALTMKGNEILCKNIANVYYLRNMVHSDTLQRIMPRVIDLPIPTISIIYADGI